MKKILLLLVAFTVSTVIWAQGNVITYTATEEPDIDWETAVGGIIIFNDSYDEETKTGVVTFHENVTYIVERAFSRRAALTSITLPDGVTSIGNYAFYDCTSLTSITLPASVTSIGERAFQNCTSLTSFNIPAGVTTIGDVPFYYCTSLTSVTINSQATLNAIGRVSNTFEPQVTEIILKGNITTIPESKFSDMQNLQTVTISANVTSIDDCAFGKCPSLTTIICEPTNPPTLGDAVFDGCNALTSIIVKPEAVGAYLNDWSSYANIITVADMDSYKTEVIAEINNALSEEVENLTDGDKAAIDGYKNTINAATDAATINTAKNNTFAIIELRSTKNSALAAIDEAMKGETSEYLKSLVQEYIDNINAATDPDYINNEKDAAIAKLKEIVPIYKASKADILGIFGTKANGPAVRVISNDDKEIILYNTKKVSFFEETTAE